MSDKATEIVRQLLEREVPEIAAGEVEVRAMSRRPGYRAKVAVSTRLETVDPVAACVGQRGARIKNVVNALKGERIDLVRWHDDARTLIANALQPAEIQAIVIDHEHHRATVFVTADQRVLVEGPRGENVELASALVGYELVIEVMT